MGTPRGAGVDTDPEVRVRFPSVVMKVVGLWGHSRAGNRPEREARRNERRPVVRQRGLLASLAYYVALVSFFRVPVARWRMCALDWTGTIERALILVRGVEEGT